MYLRTKNLLIYMVYQTIPYIYKGMVGVHGFEPWTSSLSETRSNQLSYTPIPAAIQIYQNATI